MIGHDPMYDYTFKAMWRYAEKVDAELIRCTKRNLNKKRGRINKKLACDEKLHIEDLLTEYDRLLYLDADILITPHAPDIFQEYPRLDTIYMFDEGNLDRTQAIQDILSIFPCDRPWPTKQGNPVYYNAGMVLCSKDSNIFKFAQISDLHRIYNCVEMYEQTYFNYLIVKHQQRMETVDLKYNQMCSFGNPEDRFNAYFIHYAGKGYSEDKKRRTYTIIQDYFKFYADDDPLLIKFKKRLNYFKFTIRNEATIFCKRIRNFIKRGFRAFKAPI